MKANKMFGRITFPIASMIVIVAVFALSMGLYYGINVQAKKVDINQQLTTGTAFYQPRAISQFKLIDNKGLPFTNANLNGHWTFFFFGFINCPHICPMTMAELSKVYKTLKQKNVPEPQFVLVTIDPARDSVQRLNTYVTAFNKHFIGATGDQKELDKLTKNMNVLYMKVKPKESAAAANYDIDHSGTIMLINPQGKLAGIFSMPHEGAKIATDFIKIREHS